MKVSLYVNSKSDISFLNTYFNKERKEKIANFSSNITEIYLSSRTVWNIFEKEIIDDKESFLFGKLMNLKKPISIIPSSFLLYTPIIEISNDEENESNRITKIDYLNCFYEQTSYDSIPFRLNSDSFSKYMTLYKKLEERFNLINDRQNKSTILQFIGLNTNKSTSTKKIAPFQYIESTPREGTTDISHFFHNYSKNISRFSDFLLYISLDDLFNIDEFENIEYLSKFNNIFLWVPDFKEFYSSRDSIKKLKIGIEKLFEYNQNIIFLFGGLMIFYYFKDLIKELITRSNIYPSRSIIPYGNFFGVQTKKIFFPYFGRVTTPEKILNKQFKHLFDCKCFSCRNYVENSSLNANIAVKKLEDSRSSNFYHNIYGFLKKIGNEEPIEFEPSLSFGDLRLMQKWEKIFHE